MQTGKIETLPLTSSAAHASNKRLSNMAPMVKKDSQQNQSHNQKSEAPLVAPVQIQPSKKAVVTSKNRDHHPNSNSHGAILNPSLSIKIKKYIEKKKRHHGAGVGFIPKSLEQTILNEKKVKI